MMPRKKIPGPLLMAYLRVHKGKPTQQYMHPSVYRAHTLEASDISSGLLFSLS